MNLLKPFLNKLIIYSPSFRSVIYFACNMKTNILLRFEKAKFTKAVNKEFCYDV